MNKSYRTFHKRVRILIATFSLCLAEVSTAQTAAIPLPPCTSAESYVSGCVGTLTDKSGSSYTGIWKNRQPNGEGKITFPDGSTLESKFLAGQPVGPMVVRQADGTVRYKGTDKKGTLVWPDGSRYEGEVADLQPHGNGILYSPDGTIKTGEFKAGKLYGRGEIRTGDPDNTILKGIFVDGRPDGDLTGSNRHGTTWQYKIVDGKKTGFGFERFRNGMGYVGEHADNAKNGFGTIVFHDGDRYIGEFSDGKQHGWGAYISAAGDFQYIGRFKDNEFDGEAILWVDGELVFEGIVSPVAPRFRDYPLSETAKRFIYGQSANNQFRSACETTLLTNDASTISPCLQSMRNMYSAIFNRLASARIERENRETKARTEERAQELNAQRSAREGELLMRLGAALMGGDTDLSHANSRGATPTKNDSSADHKIQYTTIRLPKGAQIYCAQIGESITCR